MKCKVCGQPASINLRSYKLALCDADFVAFFEKRVQTTIKKYGLITAQDKPVIAVSGGKDSLALWHIMSALGIPCDGIYINLGIEGYSDTSLDKIIKAAEVLNRKLYVFRIASVLDCGIAGLAKALKRVPCSACGMVKRYIMNRICVEKGYNVLLTGHNLDDEASALLGNMLYWKKEYLWKKDILLEGQEGHLSKKVKPLFLCSERESAAYAIIKNIDYVYEECPFSTRAKSITYKHMLNTLEQTSPGTKLAFIKGYLKTLKDIQPVEQTAHESRVTQYCEDCGYPTYTEKCSFCWTLHNHGIHTDVKFDEYSFHRVGSPGEQMVT